jgi:hypothetical protein
MELVLGLESCFDSWVNLCLFRCLSVLENHLALGQCYDNQVRRFQSPYTTSRKDIRGEV